MKDVMTATEITTGRELFIAKKLIFLWHHSDATKATRVTSNAGFCFDIKEDVNYVTSFIEGESNEVSGQNTSR